MKNKLFMLWFLEGCGINLDVIRWEILPFLDYKKLLSKLTECDLHDKIEEYAYYGNVYGLNEVIHLLNKPAYNYTELISKCAMQTNSLEGVSFMMFLWEKFNLYHNVDIVISNVLPHYRKSDDSMLKVLDILLPLLPNDVLEYDYNFTINAFKNIMWNREAIELLFNHYTVLSRRVYTDLVWEYCRSNALMSLKCLYNTKKLGGNILREYHDHGFEIACEYGKMEIIEWLCEKFPEYWYEEGKDGKITRCGITSTKLCAIKN